MRVKRSRTGALLDKRLLLYDRNSGAMRTLIRGTRREYGPTFVGSEYVFMWTCDHDYTACAVSYWSEATGRRMQPAPLGYKQGSGELDEATGDLYLTRYRRWCGRSTTIRRGTIGAEASTSIASLPKGIAVADMSLTSDPGSGDLDLYFTRYDCRARSGDIYVLEGVNLPPPGPSD
jgi:hypothetical protein